MADDNLADGYISLYRSLLASAAFQDSDLLKVWVWCLLRANYKERWWSARTGRGKTVIHLLPGQFVFGRHSAAQQLDMKPSSVRNRMARLEKLGNVDIKVDRHCTVVTICNWERYQHPPEPRGQQSGHTSDRQRTHKGHTKDTDNNVKKVNNVDKVNKKIEEAATSDNGVPCKSVLDAYNSVCAAQGLAKAQKVTGSRRDKLKTRWAESAFREHFGEIFNRIAASDFCKGGGDKGWKADFDWIIANDSNYTKVLEGRYDNRVEPPNPYWCPPT